MSITVLMLVAVVGCGGGGGGSAPVAGTSDRAAGVLVPSQGRSIKLNNYNNWWMSASNSADESRKLEILAGRDNICITEMCKRKNITSQTIKAINPSARVYRVYDLCIKNNWDWDWAKPSDTTGMQTPLSKAVIDENNWWLRDGNGNIVKDSDQTGWYLDVGKPGFKEAFLQAVLDRNAGQGFDGFVFDYWWSELSSILDSATRPTAYRTDNDWYTKAWRPFISYVMSGLRVAGYRIIGNCVGQYDDPRSTIQWQRTQVDGVIYEQWAVDWSGNWLSGSTIQQRISGFSRDPLEAWTADYGIRSSDKLYDQKVTVAVAMYYVAIPMSQEYRSYHHFRDRKIYWESIWNVNIGTPVEAAVKKPGKYFWSRRFTQGIVLLNYESSGEVSHSLDRLYRDTSGQPVSGTVTLKAHTAMILTADAGL